MKQILKRVGYTLLCLIVGLGLAGLVLAYWPGEWRVANKGISTEQATQLRQNYTGPHSLLTTSDGETLFLRRWNPDTLVPAKKGIAVLIFHGFTAHSGPYSMAGIPIAKAGYTVFGLDYRGHGLSGGNRGDNPGPNHWYGDLAEAVRQVKQLGFPKVVVLGHSLGVAAAICAADTIPGDISGLVLLSGAYEGRKAAKPLPWLKQAHYVACAVFRPSYRAIEYYREGMTIPTDTLFTFRYTPRFMMLLDVKKLRLPATLNIPVLVGVGDQDELFSVEKVKELYNLVPGNQKEFLTLKNATHAKIPRESWEAVAAWLDKTYL